eukprot:NODE_1521_length_1503_cov_21.292985_g1374_i0.p1 GENE.NODE_1521_length_1503_cov_21.292985_g1374_i0~~NODE_1521_length_1503_cov_21.292985_g1374_i0.p1  ORF type:complete len:275 (-),score=63.99 NODE_1521_length_1503_cov_21.292985_g1374_i0:677-1450(-)
MSGHDGGIDEVTLLRHRVAHLESIVDDFRVFRHRFADLEHVVKLLQEERLEQHQHQQNQQHQHQQHHQQQYGVSSEPKSAAVVTSQPALSIWGVSLGICAAAHNGRHSDCAEAASAVTVSAVPPVQHQQHPSRPPRPVVAGEASHQPSLQRASPMVPSVHAGKGSRLRENSPVATGPLLLERSGCEEEIDGDESDSDASDNSVESASAPNRPTWDKKWSEHKELQIRKAKSVLPKVRPARFRPRTDAPRAHYRSSKL